MHLYHYSCLLRSRAVRDNGHAYAQDATVLSAVEHFVTLLPFGVFLASRVPKAILRGAPT